jgi:YebC/PmpR family DNA-binding regulatory protein
MSGHSKWSTIKRKKGAADQKRGREFSKLIRVITSSVRKNGADPEHNPILRAELDKAKAINMPADTINRAIKRGTGEAEGAAFDEITYEGYGPCGIAMLIETLTDNRNRTTAEVRHVLNQYGGSLGEAGCVQWMFSKKGIIAVPAAGIDEDNVMEIAIDAGAEDVSKEGDSFEITCLPGDLENLKKALADAGFAIESSEVSMEAQTTIDVSDKASSVLKLIDMLEELDDVQNVYSNFDISEEAMRKVDG